MTRPSIFVGSSSEGLEIARAVRSLLAADAEVTLWNEGFFGLGSTFIETLVNELPRFDFAILVLTADDLVTSRGSESFGPRDNVIFELGLFIGHIGRSRTFVVHQLNANVKIPSDLSGVTTAGYTWPRQDGSYRSAVGPACDSIREVVRDLGVSERKVNVALNDVKSRQTEVESRVQVAESNIERLFAHTMSPRMYLNLKKLASGRFGPFEKSGGLQRELRHLREIGYVTFLCHLRDVPKQGDDLSEYIEVTPVGLEFIEFREALDTRGG